MKRRTFLKRVLSGLLATVLLTGTLAGCGKKDSENSGGDGSLTYWIKMDATKISPTTDDFGTILCYQEIAKNTGVDVKFIHPPPVRRTTLSTL